MNVLATAGASFSPLRISRLVSAFPYMSLLALSSSRKVAPLSETPANSPREREYRGSPPSSLRRSSPPPIGRPARPR